MDDIDLEAPLILERLRRGRALRNFPIPQAFYRPRRPFLPFLALIFVLSIGVGVGVTQMLRQPQELSFQQLAILKSLVYVLEDRHGVPTQRAYSALHKKFDVRSIEDLSPKDYDAAVGLLLKYQDLAPISAE
ncbi:MAG: hypothetical protein MI785_03480 [Kiloniellales bacterium]|nr:hypothetical protein [Kiloniellales bacterium]